MNDLRFDRIEKFLDGELTGDQLKEFEKELKENPNLQKELKLHKEVNEAIMEKDVMDLRSKLETIMGSSSFIIRRKVKLLMEHKLAASVILLLGFGLLVSLIANESKFFKKKTINDYYKPYCVSTTTRSTAIPFDNLLAEALKDFETEDRKIVQDLFEQILKRDSSEITPMRLLKLLKTNDLSTKQEW